MTVVGASCPVTARLLLVLFAGLSIQVGCADPPESPTPPFGGPAAKDAAVKVAAKPAAASPTQPLADAGGKVPDVPGVPKLPKPPPKKASESAQPTKRPPDREIGEGLWRQSCWQCHGERGHGDGPAAAALVGGVPTLQGRVRSIGAEKIENLESLVDVIQSGKGRMPAYSEDIDRGDSRKIVFYLRDQLEGKGPGGGPPEEDKAPPEGGEGAEGADAPGPDVR